MVLDFKDKIVLITGGTRGIGFEIANLFSQLGAYVIITGTKQKYHNEHVNYNEYLCLDYSSSKSIKNFLECLKKITKISIFINNAGINKIDSILDINIDDWDLINKVNLRGPFILTQAVSNIMKKNLYGRIINISSIFGIISRSKRAAYSASKAGLIGFTKATALDLAKFNILVNSISPGFVDTELTRKILGIDEISHLEKKIPQGRLASPKEIANLVLYLSSEENSYMTGQNIVIDGGYTIA